ALTRLFPRPARCPARSGRPRSPRWKRRSPPASSHCAARSPAWTSRTWSLTRPSSSTSIRLVTSPASDKLLFQNVDAYERFMGRYSTPLAHEFARAVGVTAGERVVDVGCGTGALTTVLAELVGADHVAAVDPSEP